MSLVMRRSFPRRYPHFEQAATGSPVPAQLPRGALVLGGPAGPVSRGKGSDLTYNGMDPSDRSTWVRPYRPVAGMIAYLNFDPFTQDAGKPMHTATQLRPNGRAGARALDGTGKRKRGRAGRAKPNTEGGQTR